MHTLLDPWIKPTYAQSTLDQVIMLGELAVMVGGFIGVLWCYFYLVEVIKDWRVKWRKRKSA